MRRKAEIVYLRSFSYIEITFWGNNHENNDGFGSSNIHDNIEDRENQTPLPNVGNINQSIGINNNPTVSAPFRIQKKDTFLKGVFFLLFFARGVSRRRCGGTLGIFL